MFSTKFGLLCAKLGRRVGMLADVNKSLEKELERVIADPTRYSPAVKDLSAELENAYKERDELSRKYNLMVVAWAMECGRKVQAQREVQEYKRIFKHTVQHMVKTGLPFPVHLKK